MADNKSTHRPLRVLFHVNDFGKGGTETALIAWLHALDAAHIKVDVSVAFPTDDLAFWRAHSFPDGVSVHILASRPWMHALHEVRRRHKLSKRMKVIKKALTYGVLRPLFDHKLKGLFRQYDVICDFDMSLRHIAGKFGITWVGVNHFSIASRFAEIAQSRIKKRESQLFRYDAITVQTAAMMREGTEVFPRLTTKLVEVPNIIDPAALQRRANEAAPLPRRPYIVSVARLDEGQKDHATLLCAFADMRRSGLTRYDLCIVGEGPHQEQLEAQVRELGLKDSVIFAGFHGNPHPFILNAQALVLSSRYEGFGMVLGEAMALGVPVIATDCPTGPRDLLDAGNAGLLVPIGDVTEMCAAMRRILTDDLLRARLITGGLERVQHFHPTRAARRMTALATNAGVLTLRPPA